MTEKSYVLLTVYGELTKMISIMKIFQNWFNLLQFQTIQKTTALIIFSFRALVSKVFTVFFPQKYDYC